MARQLEMKLKTWGGRREGAGRKRIAARPMVAHRPRPRHRATHPVHVTLRARGGLPPFREQTLFLRMRECIQAASHSVVVGAGFRVLQFSVQRDHVHLIVEAHDAGRLSRGVQGLVVRLARAINRTLDVRGKVWGDRFHARDLRTPREVRHAIVYVLMNAKKHVRNAPAIDPFSSAPWFDGFVGVAPLALAEAPIVAPRSWLARKGWRRRGKVGVSEAPGRTNWESAESGL